MEHTDEFEQNDEVNEEPEMGKKWTDHLPPELKKGNSKNPPKLTPLENKFDLPDVLWRTA